MKLKYFYHYASYGLHLGFRLRIGNIRVIFAEIIRGMINQHSPLIILTIQGGLEEANNLHPAKDSSNPT